MGKNQFNGEYLHRLFCEAMEVNQLPHDYLEIITLDEIDYSERLTAEEIYADTSSVYKYHDGTVTLFINETILNKEPFIATEILCSQFFDIYYQHMPYYQNIAEMNYKNRFIFPNKSKAGFNFWLSFVSSYTSTKLTKVMYGDLPEDIDFVNPYAEEYFNEDVIKILKNISKSEETKDVKIDVILYLLGKIAATEDIDELGSKTFMQLHKYKFCDISQIVDGELGKNINELYKKLVISVLSHTNIMTFIELDNLIKKVKENL